MTMNRKKIIIICIGICCLCSETLCVHASIFSNTPQIPFVLNVEPETYIEVNISGISYGHELLWTANTTGTNYEESAVTYADGTAYIGSCATHGGGHDKIFAVNTSNGEILWSKYTGPGYVGPVIDGDVVYIGTCTHGYYPNNEYMYAFNRFTGQQLWKTPIYGGIAESIQYDEDKIYFCSGFYDTKLYALNKADGSINWTYPTGYAVCPNKPMLKDNAVYGAFWNGYNTGKLYKINATTGQEIWNKPLSAGPWDNSITADGEGRLFLAIYYDSTMNAYSDSTGQLLWTYHLHGGSLSFNAYHNGRVFIADTLGYVYALTASTGQLLWETKIGGSCDISSPTISGGLIFIGTRDGINGAFYALNETTGSILWRYGIGASVTAPPSIVNGLLLCGTDGWNMYAFDVGVGGGEWLLHRYDSWNTAYSTVGLTRWEYVKTSCSTQGNTTTCSLTNTYDHQVQNIVLHLPFSAYWYTESGDLLKENADTYTIESLQSGETRTFLITHEQLFQVAIVKPGNGIYWRNKKLLEYCVPVVIGSIDVEVQITNASEIDHVDFYLDDTLQAVDSLEPFSWRWDKRAFGVYTVKVIAYHQENSASFETRIWKFL